MTTQKKKKRIKLPRGFVGYVGGDGRVVDDSSYDRWRQAEDRRQEFRAKAHAKLCGGG